MLCFTIWEIEDEIADHDILEELTLSRLWGRKGSDTWHNAVYLYICCGLLFGIPREGQRTPWEAESRRGIGDLVGKVSKVFALAFWWSHCERKEDFSPPSYQFVFTTGTVIEHWEKSTPGRRSGSCGTTRRGFILPLVPSRHYLRSFILHFFSLLFREAFDGIDAAVFIWNPVGDKA